MQEEDDLKYSSSIVATDSPASPTRFPAWAELGAHAVRLRHQRIEALFDADPARFEQARLEHDGLIADFSKQLIDPTARESLVALAQQACLPEAIHALFAGEALNFTEDRAALHMALRGGCALPDADAAPQRTTLARMREFARGLGDGTVKSATGVAFRDVINLGIGGSDLGPRMAGEALRAGKQAGLPRVHFVANIDPSELEEALAEADPRTTLFIVSSKSFSTAETLANARAAVEWLEAGLGADADYGAHLCAVSNATAAAIAFGIPEERVFPIPAWVGGRYSVWSAIGLPFLIAIGEAGFDALLAGAASIDTHFRTAPLDENIPVMMGLTGLWNTDFLAIESLAVLPYAHGLRSFPAWLQQLEMESNGKRCLRDGTTSAVHTSPIVWGGAGTVGQHAFHQLFYQGTRRVALDFLVPVLGDRASEHALVENALAQSAALMSGRDLAAAQRALENAGLPPDQVEKLAPHLVCPGNQPSTTLLVAGLSPHTLGQLMALYEHKVFVQGWIWGINSFDQYGVELGKEMARALSDPDAGVQHAATAGLIDTIDEMRRNR